MNVVKINGKTYKYEFLWKDNKHEKSYDSNNEPLQFPEHNKISNWNDKNAFITQLDIIQNSLHESHNFIPNDNYKHCLICNKKNIGIGLYSINGIRWETSVKHYIKKHNIKPSSEFIDFVYRQPIQENKERVIARINGLSVIKSDKKYFKLDRNQILIMDALMMYGKHKMYIDKATNTYRYSEHAGLLDFNNNKLEKIVISGNTTRVDPNDDDIFLPRNMIEALDYEYIFHTHPPTPHPGSRAKFGILYEFPSISDIFHFIKHYNEGRTQGSIIIAPEGMYIIRKKIIDDQNIVIDEDKFYKDALNAILTNQRSAIAKYGTQISINTFYSKISQDKIYINNINEIINNHKIHIDYYSRIKDKTKKWIIDTIYLPVYAVELK